MILEIADLKPSHMGLRAIQMMAFSTAFFAIGCSHNTSEAPPRTWGIALSPIDIQAGNTNEEIAVWSIRYLSEVFSSESECEEGIETHLAEHPPRYNLEAVCLSPHPEWDPIQVLDCDDILKGECGQKLDLLY